MWHFNTTQSLVFFWVWRFVYTVMYSKCILIVGAIIKNSNKIQCQGCCCKLNFSLIKDIGEIVSEVGDTARVGSKERAINLKKKVKSDAGELDHYHYHHLWVVGSYKYTHELKIW